MVDFSKRLAKKSAAKPIAPQEIYDRLDRASDKGPMRPAQISFEASAVGDIVETALHRSIPAVTAMTVRLKHLTRLPRRSPARRQAKCHGLPKRCVKHSITA